MTDPTSKDAAKHGVLPQVAKIFFDESGEEAGWWLEILGDRLEFIEFESDAREKAEIINRALEDSFETLFALIKENADMKERAAKDLMEIGRLANVVIELRRKALLADRMAEELENACQIVQHQNRRYRPDHICRYCKALADYRKITEVKK